VSKHQLWIGGFSQSHDGVFGLAKNIKREKTIDQYYLSFINTKQIREKDILGLGRFFFFLKMKKMCGFDFF
jgi:hypothetical protein